MNIQLTNFFTDQLPADPNLENTRREVLEAVYSFVRPIKTSNPTLLHVSDEMQHTLDFSNEDIQSREFLEFVTGNSVLKNSKPFAMCYAGHQFGNWAGQLGDGRAINLGEIKDWAVQLKGSGPTPYSRTADGLAVLRSSVREYLCSEAMHHLGVPSTRALSLSLTGDKVLRDVMYNGNPAHEKGAIVSRVAKSFLRFGNFEIFSSRNDIKNLKILTDYTIKSHFSHLGKPSKEVYLQFFQEVSSKTLEMIIHWQRV
ncbi:protein adenylyltransferase SelO family protein, partial [Flavobacteriaceae bacterium]|nr:protein adenylyltransferase SelO family protein [Flavobacteriaceae bacterium]